MTECSLLEVVEVHCAVAGGPAACRVIYRVVMTSLLYIGEDRGHRPSVCHSQPPETSKYF